MFIITILDITKNSIEILDCYNDTLEMQTAFMDKITELSINDIPNTSYEPIITSKNVCSLYRKDTGWITNYKKLEKIITIHERPEYNIIDAE